MIGARDFTAPAPSIPTTTGRAPRPRPGDRGRAAAQVKGILSEVSDAMAAAMTAAGIGVRRAQDGAQVARSTGDTTGKLARALKDSSEAAREIATVAQQQDQGIEQVLRAMNEIYLATEETIAQTGAVASQARSLNDLATALRSAAGGRPHRAPDGSAPSPASAAAI